MLQTLPTLDRDAFRRDGYVVVPHAVDEETIDRLLADLAPLVNRLDTRRGGIRHILRDSPAVQQLAADPRVRSVAEAAVGQGAFAVRGILFDKTADANWKVVWHQDLTIAVRERVDAADFGPWSDKDGVTHVQPPVELLAEMVAVRIHLDDCTATNGPVRVLPAPLGAPCSLRSKSIRRLIPLSAHYSHPVDRSRGARVHNFTIR